MGLSRNLPHSLSWTSNILRTSPNEQLEQRLDCCKVYNKVRFQLIKDGLIQINEAALSIGPYTLVHLLEWVDHARINSQSCSGFYDIKF